MELVLNFDEFYINFIIVVIINPKTISLGCPLTSGVDGPSGAIKVGYLTIDAI
jgi:hypothetical protein